MTNEWIGLNSKKWSCIHRYQLEIYTNKRCVDIEGWVEKLAQKKSQNYNCNFGFLIK